MIKDIFCGICIGGILNRRYLECPAPACRHPHPIEEIDAQYMASVSLDREVESTLYRHRWFHGHKQKYGLWITEGMDIDEALYLIFSSYSSDELPVREAQSTQEQKKNIDK